MQFSKTNDIRNNTASLTSGTLSSGEVANVLDQRFAKNATFTGSTITLNLGSVTNCKYVAIHGLYTNLKGNSVLLSCTVGGNPIDGSSSLFTATDSTHSIMFVNQDPDFAGLSGTLVITILNSVNSSSTWSFGVIRAGDSLTIPSGLRGGQVYSYLQSNLVTQGVQSSNAAPNGQINKRVAPSVSINIDNLAPEWIQGNIIEVMDTYSVDGIISVYDGLAELERSGGDLVYNRNWSWAAFGLTSQTATGQSNLNRLVTMRWSFKAAF